jgi:hypothetical protein
MRRALLIPLKRWQASTEQQQLEDTLEEDDHCSVLLMQGLNSSSSNVNGSSSNRGKNRGVGRAIAGARAAVGGCAGDSKLTWQQLSKVFA